MTIYHNDVGQAFLEYHQRAGFEVLPPSSLLDPAIPMTFVGSAGLSQVEGAIQRGEDRSGERYALLQPCFRHFDVQKVGGSPFHLSLFMMGGAFQFGHMARESTLGSIWAFLVDWLGVDPQRIWATVFAGGGFDGRVLIADDDTYHAWRAQGLYANQIVEVGIEAGFWKQGDGLLGHDRYHKCGPTTELFFDRGKERMCGPTCRPGCSCGRFVEIANILFIHWQYDEITKRLQTLTTPFDEVVIGVERMNMTLQGRESVYEAPDLAPLVRLARQQKRSVPGLNVRQEISSARIIADHIRALLFLTADGAPPPGKGGRARIMRTLIREVIANEQLLGTPSEAAVPELIDLAVALGGRQYTTGLHEARPVLLKYFRAEVSCFAHTLARGQRQLDRMLLSLRDNRLSGAQTLQLVKEYGLPLASVQAIMHQKGVKLNAQDYQQAYTAWRQTQADTK